MSKRSILYTKSKLAEDEEIGSKGFKKKSRIFRIFRKIKFHRLEKKGYSATELARIRREDKDRELAEAGCKEALSRVVAREEKERKRHRLKTSELRGLDLDFNLLTLREDGEISDAESRCSGWKYTEIEQNVKSLFGNGNITVWIFAGFLILCLLYSIFQLLYHIMICGIMYVAVIMEILLLSSIVYPAMSLRFALKLLHILLLDPIVDVIGNRMRSRLQKIINKTVKISSDVSTSRLYKRPGNNEDHTHMI
ncbi:TPA_asm: G [Phellodendron betacytorhabdovirus 1]|nr:TPA_asm: G [Phellodendron betacytorhabdovirus 1]